jgi:hypothetical protein
MDGWANHLGTNLFLDSFDSTQIFAQKYLPPQAWGTTLNTLSDGHLVPFFNLVGFVLGTYINTQTKRRRRLAALKKQVIF